VVDTAGCRMDTNLVVKKALPPSSANFMVAADHCQKAIGALSMINIVGGKSPFTLSVDSLRFVKDTVKSLLAGTYSVYIRDANGCVLKQSPVVVGNVP